MHLESQHKARENRESHGTHCLASLAFLTSSMPEEELVSKNKVDNTWGRKPEILRSLCWIYSLRILVSFWVTLCLKRLQGRASEKECLIDLVCNCQNGADEACWLFLLVAIYYFHFCLSVLVLAALKLLSSLFYPLFVPLAIFFLSSSLDLPNLINGFLHKPQCMGGGMKLLSQDKPSHIYSFIACLCASWLW